MENFSPLALRTLVKYRVPTPVAKEIVGYMRTNRTLLTFGAFNPEANVNISLQCIDLQAKESNAVHDGRARRIYTHLALYPGFTVKIPRWFCADPLTQQLAQVSILIHRAHDLADDRARDLFRVCRVEQKGGPAGDAYDGYGKNPWPAFLGLMMMMMIYPG